MKPRAAAIDPNDDAAKVVEREMKQLLLLPLRHWHLQGLMMKRGVGEMRKGREREKGQTRNYTRQHAWTRKEDGDKTTLVMPKKRTRRPENERNSNKISRDNFPHLQLYSPLFPSPPRLIFTPIIPFMTWGMMQQQQQVTTSRAGGRVDDDVDHCCGQRCSSSGKKTTETTSFRDNCREKRWSLPSFTSSSFRATTLHCTVPSQRFRYELTQLSSPHTHVLIAGKNFLPRRRLWNCGVGGARWARTKGVAAAACSSLGASSR